MAAPGSAEQRGGEEDDDGPECCLGHEGIPAFPYNILLGCVCIYSMAFWESGELPGILWNKKKKKKIPLKWSFCASDEINVNPGAVVFLFLIRFVSPKSSGKICSYSIPS